MSLEKIVHAFPQEIVLATCSKTDITNCHSIASTSHMLF